MKQKQDFQIFIISRFLVSLIYVVLSEFLIWFATDRIKHLFEGVHTAEFGGNIVIIRNVVSAIHAGRGIQR